MLHARLQLLHQARFANTRLTAEHHHLALTVLSLRPALEQERDFGLPAHQRREPTPHRRVEPALRAALSQDTVQPHWCNRAPERLDTRGRHRPQTPAPGDIGSGAQHHRIGCGEPLQPGRNVGHFTQGQLFLTVAATHGPYDHQSGVDAQAHSEPNTPLLHQAQPQCVHRLDHSQPCPYRAQGVIFMGLGVAKVDQEAIAQILRNVPLKAPDHLGAGGW